MRESSPFSPPPFHDAEFDDWDRYLAGELTGVPVTTLHARIAQRGGDPARLHDIAELFRVNRRRVEATAPSPRTAAMVGALHHRLQLDADATRVPEQKNPRVVPLRDRSVTRAWTRVLARGAVAAAACVAAFVWWTSASQPHLQEQSYVTQRGEQLSVQLPDGSQAILAPDTRLRYSQGSKGSRLLRLDGQAHFTVTHDPTQPFVIQSGSVVSRVLGTSFSVRAYVGDGEVQVAVAEGKVALANGASETVLLAGDVGRVSEDGAPEVIHNVTIADAFGWMRGQVAFDMVPLADVVKELNRWYDVDIVIADSVVAKQRVTLTFTDETVDEMIEAIASVTDARLEQTGSRATLSSRRHD